MKKNYIMLFILVLNLNIKAQNMNYSLDYIGTNSGTGNIEIALVATPDFTEQNGNSADMGAVVSISGGGYLLPTNTGFVNNCVFTPPATNVCDYAIPATEWDATYLTGPSSSSGGRYVYQLLRTPGVTNVFFDAESGTPIIMAVFQIAGNPTSGDIVLLENTDPLISTEPNENYLNINYVSATGGSTADVLGVTDTSPILFSVLNTSDFEVDDIKIYPNPTNGLINIKGINDSYDVELFNISGQKVIQMKKVNDFYDMSNLENGIYFMKIKTIEGFILEKIIKQ